MWSFTVSREIKSLAATRSAVSPAAYNASTSDSRTESAALVSSGSASSAAAQSAVATTSPDTAPRSAAMMRSGLSDFRIMPMAPARLASRMSCGRSPEVNASTWMSARRSAYTLSAGCEPSASARSSRTMSIGVRTASTSATVCPAATTFKPRCAFRIAVVPSTIAGWSSTMPILVFLVTLFIPERSRCMPPTAQTLPWTWCHRRRLQKPQPRLSQNTPISGGAGK